MGFSVQQALSRRILSRRKSDYQPLRALVAFWIFIEFSILEQVLEQVHRRLAV